MLQDYGPHPSHTHQKKNKQQASKSRTVMCWVHPRSSNSHHRQDYYIFSRASPTNSRFQTRPHPTSVATHILRTVSRCQRVVILPGWTHSLQLFPQKIVESDAGHASHIWPTGAPATLPPAHAPASPLSLPSLKWGVDPGDVLFLFDWGESIWNIKKKLFEMAISEKLWWVLDWHFDAPNVKSSILFQHFSDVKPKKCGKLGMFLTTCHSPSQISCLCAGHFLGSNLSLNEINTRAGPP